MSGLVRGAKKLVKGSVKFVKRYWRPILAVAATVFTAGLATVGTAGFSFAANAAGGGIGGFLSAAGSTLSAGVSAIGGSLGLSKGVNMASFGGTGMASLGNGAAAQALGMAGNGVTTAGQIAAGQAGAQGASFLPSSVVANAGAGAGAGAGASVPAGGWGAMTPNVGPFAPAAQATTPFGGSLLNSPVGQILTNAGVGFVNSYMQARAMEDAAEDAKPLAMWGVPLRDGGGRESGVTSMDGPMWSPQSFARPRAPALMSPNNPTDPNWDPTRGYFGG